MESHRRLRRTGAGCVSGTVKDIQLFTSVLATPDNVKMLTPMPRSTAAKSATTTAMRLGVSTLL